MNQETMMHVEELEAVVAPILVKSIYEIAWDLGEYGPVKVTGWGG